MQNSTCLDDLLIPIDDGSGNTQPLVSRSGEKRCLDSKLWHACAGSLVSLPDLGSHVVYFLQGHSEQVAVSTNKEVNARIPNYPSLPPQLICQVHNVTMHADVETDEVYAQMTLQPLSPEEQKDASFLPSNLGITSKQPTNYFCKTLTASDTSAHGGFSVPRRAAEKLFTPLDYTQLVPAQELLARDLHGNQWTFRHVYRGHPKRHLLTTGWNLFVSGKRLVARDSVLFIRNEKDQLLIGIRRANRPQTLLPPSVLSSDSMHLGLLDAAAHAAATSSCFIIFYNPKVSPSDFIVPLAKYVKAVYHTCVSVGMRFQMLFETEELIVHRYTGTITGISDLDPVRWPNSHWRSVKVGWDESTVVERQPRVSLWETERPLTTFPTYTSPFSPKLKQSWSPGLPSLNGNKGDDLGMNTPLMLLRGDCSIQSVNFKDTRVVNPPKQALLSPTLFQQLGNVPNKPAGLMQPQMPQQSHPQPISSTFQQHSCCDSNGTSMTGPIVSLLHSLTGSFSRDETSHKLNLARSDALSSSGGWPHTRGTVQSVTPSFPQAEQLGPTHSSMDQNALSLPRLPGTECSVDQEGSNDTKDHLLLENNIESMSPLLQNGISSIRRVRSDCDTALTSSSYMSTTGIGGSLNTEVTPSSCIGKSAFLQYRENVDQEMPPITSRIKVYKRGSVCRSLDILQFNSYHELRGELARTFGLEGQLEDRQKLGWNLVFVDHENDILLLDDCTWLEFVNCVRCIMLLSPQEVQQMSRDSIVLRMPGSL